MKFFFTAAALLALAPSAFADSRLCNEFYPAKAMPEKNLICSTLAGPLRFTEESVSAGDFIERPLTDLTQLNGPGGVAMISQVLRNMAKAGYVPNNYYFTHDFVERVGSEPMGDAINTIMATYSTHYKRPQ